MKPLPGPERWQRIAPLLQKALETLPEQRRTFLEQACGEDSVLRAEVEELLAADSDAGKFLDAPVDISVLFASPGEGAEAAPDVTRLAGTFIGSYKVVREIGRGGMGVIYEAEQQRPRRSVALKVILGGRHVDAETVRMFQRESDSLARLKHPSIAAIFESGCTDEGQHFFAMELAEGRTLDDYLDEGGTPATQSDMRRRLALFRKIAAAVAYAHQRGVIHRDLKPSNILVLRPDGARTATAGDESGGSGAPGPGAEEETPNIKILDFGLARITEPDAEAPPTLTIRGSVQGTLPYMSPEQVRGRSDEIDVRTDVYSLGVLLYRMLSGRLPHDLEGAGITEAARIICEQPPRPLGASARGGPRVDRDLAIIVHKALEKDPARRYQTAAALDEDVGRYLNGQPILARPSGAAYQIRKLIARHKAPFVGVVAALLALFAVAIVTTVQARRIAAERDRANREAETAVRVSGFLTDLFKVSDPTEARGNAIKAREILDKGVERIGKELADEPLVQARLMLTMGNVYRDLGLYREAEPLLEQSLATRRRLGEENLETVASMNGLAKLYLSQGRLVEAEKIYTRILDLRLRIQGEEHPDTLMSMSGLAHVYRQQARYTDAEKLFSRTLEVRRRAQGDDDPETLYSARDVATCFYAQRRFAEDEALLRPTLEKMRRVLGNDHPNTLMTEHDLANAYEAQGRHAEAEELFREALDGQRRILGPDHPDTLRTMNSLAVLYDHEERYAEEEPLLLDALDKQRRVLGEDHQDTLNTLTNLANVDSAQGRYHEAETLYRETLNTERRLLGEDHPDTTNTLYNLACLDALRGNRKGALDWLGQAVAHGYSHADQIEKDSDLKSLRSDPAFAGLIARARKNSGK